MMSSFGVILEMVKADIEELKSGERK